ncbi:MAG: hypothetical protein ACPGVO_10140 [Spirulinaceae cyanobacterium]
MRLQRASCLTLTSLTGRSPFSNDVENLWKKNALLLESSGISPKRIAKNSSQPKS